MLSYNWTARGKNRKGHKYRKHVDTLNVVHQLMSFEFWRAIYNISHVVKWRKLRRHKMSEIFRFQLVKTGSNWLKESIPFTFHHTLQGLWTFFGGFSIKPAKGVFKGLAYFPQDGLPSTFFFIFFYFFILLFFYFFYFIFFYFIFIFILFFFIFFIYLFCKICSTITKQFFEKLEDPNLDVWQFLYIFQIILNE